MKVNFFLQFLVDILSLGSRSVEPHNFTDPDQRRQNLADPTDPDPKHWFNVNYGINIGMYLKMHIINKILSGYQTK